MDSMPKRTHMIERSRDKIDSQRFSTTHLEIPVGELIFHVFSLAYNRKKPGWCFHDDRHAHHELIYTAKGEGTYEMRGQPYVVQQGDFFFTPRNIVHNGWSHPDVPLWESFVVELDFSLAHDPDIYLDDLGVFPAILPFYKHFILEQQPVLRAPAELQPQIELIVERLTLEMSSRSPDYDLILQSSLIEYLVLISRAARHSLSQVPLRQYAGRAKRLFRLEKARQYLQYHYKEDLKLNEIAGQAHLSQFHFVRLFKEAFGLTPLQYQTHLRLEEAKRLLVMTDLQISEIAYRLGFSSPEYFSRTFSSKVGTPPRDFSRRLQEPAGGR